MNLVVGYLWNAVLVDNIVTVRELLFFMPQLIYENIYNGKILHVKKMKVYKWEMIYINDSEGEQYKYEYNIKIEW